jgi:hypothetical protein
MGFVENQVKKHLLKTYQQIKVCNPTGLCKECKKNAALKPQLIEMGICSKECKK